MGLLGDFAAYIDNLKRRGMNTAKDLVSDPMGLLGRNVSALSESLPAAPGEPQNEMLARPGMQDWATGVALNAPTMGLLGHTVYHGSPHKFGKFDASKIGTGEGAQAYGYGTYLAENPGVARGYSRMADAFVKIDGVPYEAATTISNATPGNYAAAALSRFPNDKKAALEWLGDFAPKEAKAIVRKAKSIEKVTGNTYTVDLPDEWLPKMLDWDKPLAEQPEAVRKLGAEVFAKEPRYDQNYTRGMELYHELNAGNGPRASPDAAKKLRDAGIPGIRYLDQGSRGKDGGTYNYVVFPGMEHLLKILERE